MTSSAGCAAAAVRALVVAGLLRPGSRFPPIPPRTNSSAAAVGKIRCSRRGQPGTCATESGQESGERTTEDPDPSTIAPVEDATISLEMDDDLDPSALAPVDAESIFLELDDEEKRAPAMLMAEVKTEEEKGAQLGESRPHTTSEIAPARPCAFATDTPRWSGPEAQVCAGAIAACDLDGDDAYFEPLTDECFQHFASSIVDCFQSSTDE